MITIIYKELLTDILVQAVWQTHLGESFQLMGDSTIHPVTMKFTLRERVYFIPKWPIRIVFDHGSGDASWGSDGRLRLL